MKPESDRHMTADKEVWAILFDRQVKNLQNKGSEAYLQCLGKMNSVLNVHHLPDFEKINHWFSTSTGWSITVVPGLIPVREFFELLAKKQFCSSIWLRSKKNLDYLEEPDMFHDIFGHVPLLCDPVFSSFMHEFGKLGVEQRNNQHAILQLQRLYWFTIEFGVIQEKETKAYGAGIMSSFGETNHVASGNVKFKPFDLNEIINTPFKTDCIQSKYFVLESFHQLFNSIPMLKTELSTLKTITPSF